MSDLSDTGYWGRFGPDSIERRMLRAVERDVGLRLRPRALVLGGGSRVEVEGISDDETVIAQLIANQGAYKPAFRNKALADMFKLLWVRSQLPAAERAVLIVTAEVTPALGGWVAVAAHDLGVEILVFADDTVRPLTASL
ncbi:hypothetical protein [Microbacterium trichothecenolyticum]|uniref:Restriction endonuclease type IV Mrr domain-containing protein n=1 Tax=Microbacterium trichothecenolyticum TaxID=69370 RepID=A0ABU0TP95_MICTR|nr:hypothetical protein [Microbacterium trichothecenolyticum]MDQ1121491.1 hypothetical protein [Microbacterium trichothecenolyticum]